jgi:hypothetical protein
MEKEEVVTVESKLNIQSDLSDWNILCEFLEDVYPFQIDQTFVLEGVRLGGFEQVGPVLYILYKQLKLAHSSH